MTYQTPYPETIKHPKAFDRNKPPGFDGVFDWTWMLNEFTPNGQAKATDTPMDVDALKERRGHLLICETKEVGVPWQRGTAIGLFTLAHAHPNITLMSIWGKLEPEFGEVFMEVPGGKQERYQWRGRDEATAVVAAWYAMANKNPITTAPSANLLRLQGDDLKQWNEMRKAQANGNFNSPQWATREETTNG